MARRTTQCTRRVRRGANTSSALLAIVWCLALTAMAMEVVRGDDAVAATATTSGSNQAQGGDLDLVVPPTLSLAPVPFTLADKKQLCALDFQGYNKALRLINVDFEPKTQPPPAEPAVGPLAHPTTKGSYPRIFCYVNTISPYHKTHAQLVADTWAQRCDKTVFFSNDTGSLVVNKGTSQEISFDVVKMNAPADYHHLWMKHKESIKYIYDHYRHDYDWFYKADDDAYVIVDNLRAYLKKPEIVNNYKRQPMQLGKRFNLTIGMISIPDPKMKQEWWTKFDRWVFNSGGPGYALNRLFLDKFVLSMPKRHCLSDANAETQPEDTSTTFCLMWEGIVPWDTRDLLGRPRWHPDNPGGVYAMTPEWAAGYWYDFNIGVGGFKYAEECCSRESIGFHYVKKGGMHHMERMLYFCRTGDDVVDMETFNDKYNLKTSHTIVKYT